MNIRCSYFKLSFALFLLAVVIHSNFALFPSDQKEILPVNRDEAVLARGGRLSLCSIGAHELELLPRVGSVMAERIISRRDEACTPGRVPATPELLTSIKGIGPKTLEQLINYLCTPGEDLETACEEASV